MAAHKAGLAAPDKANLHFDMKHGPNSEWNQAVIDILVCKVKKIHRHSKYKRVVRTQGYLEDLVSEKYKRVRGLWRAGQPRKNDMDVPETPEELESRMLRDKERQLTNHRTRERRVAVRIMRILH